MRATVGLLPPGPVKLLAGSIGLCGIIAGCAHGEMLDGQDAHAGGADAARVADAAPEGADARVADAAPDAPPSQAATLLLSEVVLQPNAAEMIEIVNPGATAIDLSHYYLSDHSDYFKLPAGASVGSSDFIVKFPQGASIPAHGVVTVAIDTAANFTAAYGVAPTFAIGGGAMVAIAGTGTPSLTNTGEPVVLFYWDGASDLVRDVDILLAGVPSSTNLLADKSGVAQDGPDADATPTVYATDARTLAAQASAPGMNLSTKRIALEAGELHGGGNGLTGDDETSEDTATNWDSSYTAPTPGVVPAALVQ